MVICFSPRSETQTETDPDYNDDHTRERYDDDQIHCKRTLNLSSQLFFFIIIIFLGGGGAFSIDLIENVFKKICICKILF